MDRGSEGSRGGLVFVELIRLVVVVAFTILGYQLTRRMTPDAESARIVVGTVLGCSVGYVVGGMLGRMTGNLLSGAERRIAEVPGADLVSGGLGLIGGILVGSVVSLPLLLLPERAIGLPAMAFVQIVMGFLGYRVAMGKREDLLQLFGLTYRTRAYDLRVLDTSALMNPQLIDLVRAGVLRGTVLVPVPVLEEAQGLADSADPVRRRRARGGLDALEAIKQEQLVELRVDDRTYPQFEEVDAKVVALARDRGATLVTDDSNLARIAELQGVEVLSLRRVSQAIRPSVLPGETIEVDLVRAGREPGQAVGYLDDGSMVIVARAGALVGRTTGIVVDRIVPTSGGRMVFGHLPTEAAG